MALFFEIVYVLLCISMVLWNYYVRRQVLISINIYNIIWASMVVLYSFKWIKYYDLSLKTWAILYLALFVSNIGYNIGWMIMIPPSDSSCALQAEALEKTVLRISVISMIAIIPNTFFLIERYGVNLLSKTSQIYYDNLAGNAPTNIPYLAALAQVGCVLAGIYFINYGFRWFVMLPIILAMISILPSGSRGGLILTVFFFMMPILLMKEEAKAIFAKEKKKIIMIVLAVLMLFITLTISRTVKLDPNIYKYMSDAMLPVAVAVPSVFKLYQYFASPIGVLNSFLNDPSYSFGGNTFGPIYNMLNKFGANIEYSRYQAFFDVPIRTNVGTWIRELIQDFDVVGMIIVMAVFCVCVGFFEKRALLYKQRDDILLSSVLDTILIMSFFVWYFREGTMMVIILTCIIMRFTGRVNC